MAHRKTNVFYIPPEERARINKERAAREADQAAIREWKVRNAFQNFNPQIVAESPNGFKIYRESFTDTLYIVKDGAMTVMLSPKSGKPLTYNEFAEYCSANS